MLTLLFNTTQVFAADAVETLSAADSNAATLDAAVTQTETATATETESATAAFASAEAESATPADAETSAAAFASSEAEAVTPSDTEVSAATLGATEAESASANDSQAASAAFASAESEAVTPSSSQSASAVFGGAVNEVGVLADSQVAPPNSVIVRIHGKLHFTVGDLQIFLQCSIYRDRLVAAIADMDGGVIKEILVNAVPGSTLVNPFVVITTTGEDFQRDMTDRSNGVWGYTFTDEEFAIFGLYPYKRSVVSIYSNVV